MLTIYTLCVICMIYIIYIYIYTHIHMYIYIYVYTYIWTFEFWKNHTMGLNIVSWKNILFIKCPYIKWHCLNAEQWDIQEYVPNTEWLLLYSIACKYSKVLNSEVQNSSFFRNKYCHIKTQIYNLNLFYIYSYNTLNA